MYFFFTFPLWPIFAMLFFVIIGAGVVVEWIVQHILIISVVIWLITFLFAVLISEKGNKLFSVSCLSLFIAPYIALVSCFFNVVSALDKGDIFVLVVNLFGVFGGLISALPSLGVLALEEDHLFCQNNRNKWLAVLNYFIAFAMSIIYYKISF
ncbi:MAG: hypothetical protein Q4F17_02760 [Eubacteriales bacterium]|nr:hypothetical protein [Eubacteriales bacterium]